MDTELACAHYFNQMLKSIMLIIYTDIHDMTQTKALTSSDFP